MISHYISVGYVLAVAVISATIGIVNILAKYYIKDEVKKSRYLEYVNAGGIILVASIGILSYYIAIKYGKNCS